MPPSPSRAPTVIAGRYELDGELGRGGMAEVRAGIDVRLQRPVAVKFLLPEMAARDDIRRRFEAEARAAASLSDPRAVAVFDTGEHEGRPYIVMERLPGETLADRIAAGPIEPEWMRQVACEVLGALAAAHATGLVHRDVKPGNILLTADGHAKIADFGIAKSVESRDGSLDLTGAGQLLGTPAYLAPERLVGAPSTAQSDLYSLGVVLYEALAGRCPFAGETPIAVAQAVTAGDFQPLGEVRPGLDPSLVATVERAMAIEPDRRFESAGAMIAALSAAGQPTLVNPVVAAPTSVLNRDELIDTRIVPPPTDDAPAAAAAFPAPRHRRRPSLRVPLAVLAGLLFLALLIPGRIRGDGSGSDQPSSADASTAAPSPTASLAAELRAAAGRLGPADGARADDLAASLRHVADQVESGGGGAAATAAIVSAGAWRATGQLSAAAAATAIEVLSRVPGVTVVTVPVQPAFDGSSTAPGGGSTGAGGSTGSGDKDGKGNGKGKGKD